MTPQDFWRRARASPDLGECVNEERYETGIGPLR
jgi:hypothetical protein